MLNLYCTTFSLNLSKIYIFCNKSHEMRSQIRHCQVEPPVLVPPPAT